MELESQYSHVNFEGITQKERKTAEQSLNCFKVSKLTSTELRRAYTLIPCILQTEQKNPKQDRHEKIVQRRN